jgi:hypothetical protein
MKNSIAFAVALLFDFGYEVRAQTDSLVDVFPLAVGNEWRYNYYTYRLEPPLDAIFTDSGWVQYTVSGRQTFTDSTVWNMTLTRNYRYCQSAFPPMPNWDTCYQILDTRSKLLVERHAAAHRIYLIASDWRDVFPFTPTLTDSVAMFRYRHVDSSGTIRIRMSEPDPFCAHTFLTTLQRGIGVVAIQCSLLRCTSFHRTRHSLLNSSLVSVGETQTIPPYSLSQNYPNPFNPMTRIEYAIPKTSHVSLKVFDVLGREVATLVDEVQDVGVKSVEFDGKGLASGVYLYRLHAGTFVQTKKLAVVR